MYILNQKPMKICNTFVTMYFRFENNFIMKFHKQIIIINDITLEFFEVNIENN